MGDKGKYVIGINGTDTLVSFSMDYGCHEIDKDSGSHGLDIPEDLNIVHMYKLYPACE